MPVPPKNNRTIKDFFKPFTIPRNRLPVNNVVEDEIIVASPRPSSPSDDHHLRTTSVSSSKQNNSRKNSARSSNVSTPTRRSPKKRSLPVLLDGTEDDALIHVSPSSSQRRKMEAVEIPSIPPLPPPDRVREAPTRSAAASFSSISTLSSVPMSSQSSSRRVIRGGMQAVTNSDSGSQDTDSDELADPSTFISRKRQKLTPPGRDAAHAIEIPSTVKPSRKMTRLSEKDKRSSTTSTPRLPPSPPRTVYKHSLLNMVKQQEKEEKAAARIREMETSFDYAQRRREELLRNENNRGGGLKAAMADDSDEGERMMLAMQRTEALQDDEKFYFLRGIGPQGIEEEFPSLYRICPSPRPWAKILSKQKSRTQALLSGFVAEIATRELLPPALLSWMAGQLDREPREDLCEAYTEVLVVTARHWATSWRGYDTLSSLYQTNQPSMYRGDASLVYEQPHAYESEMNGIPQGLRYTLQVVRACCAGRNARLDNPIDKPSLVPSTILELALANIDDNIIRHADLRNVIQDSIELNLNDASDTFDESSIVEEFISAVALPAKRLCRIIISLPAFSERSHKIRRSLALKLITKDTRKGEPGIQHDEPEGAENVLTSLKNASHFAISEATDYPLLQSLIEVLDIAIDAGFSRPDSHPSNPQPFPQAIASIEKRFNSQIDAITSQLRQMSSRIKDAATSHLHRMEAKSAIERLIIRLEYSVRTRPKPRVGVFGDGGGVDEQRSFLSGFLKRAEAPRDDDESDRVSVVPVDMLSEGDISSGSDVSEVSAGVGA